MPTFRTFLEYNIDFSSNDPEARAAAIQKARKISRMSPEQIDQLEQKEARMRQQETRAETNPQVKNLKRKKENLLKQLSMLNQQIKAAQVTTAA